MSELHDLPVLVHSGFGFHSRKGFVGLVIDEKMTQMSPTEARRIAHLLLECAEAAETDAFIFRFCLDTLKGDEETAAGMLALFRKARKEAE